MFLQSTLALNNSDVNLQLQKCCGYKIIMVDFFAVMLNKRVSGSVLQ